MIFLYVLCVFFILFARLFIYSFRFLSANFPLCQQLHSVVVAVVLTVFVGKLEFPCYVLCTTLSSRMSCCKHDEDDEEIYTYIYIFIVKTGNRFHRYPSYISCIHPLLSLLVLLFHPFKWKERMNRKNMAVQIAYHYSYYMGLVVCVCSPLEAL